MRVVYAGDTNFNGSTGTLEHVVKGASQTLVTAVPTSSTYGQNVTFRATVSAVSPATGIPAGTVDFFEGTNLIGDDVAIVGGVATLSAYNLLTAGNHTITATYNGSTTFKTSTGALPNAPFVVAIANTTTTLSATPAGSTVFGQQITLTAQVNVVAPGGAVTLPGTTVTFFDGATSLGQGTVNSSGFATLQITNLSAGTHNNIRAHFDGTTNYNASNSAAISRTVTKSNTSVTLASSVPSPSTYGQTSITATVSALAPGSGIPTGTVTFRITNQAQQVTNVTVAVDQNTGIATLTPPLNVGTYTITATYNGDPNYNTANSNQISHQVQRNNTTTTVQSSTGGADAVYGEATISASVVPVTPVIPGIVPTGSVTFHISLNGGPAVDSQPIPLNASGVATLPTLGVGVYVITATYSGDGNFNLSNSGTLNQTILAASTSVQVVSGQNPSVVGQTVTFTATVSPVAPGGGVPTGTVDFVFNGTTYGDDVPLVNGQASAQIPFNTVSSPTFSVDVTYTSNTPNYLGSSGSVAQTVTKGTAAGTLTSSSNGNPALVGTTVTFTANFSAIAPASGVPTGTADLFIDGNPVSVGQTLNGAGTVTFNVTNAAILSQGNHDVFVRYNGDPNFNAADSVHLTQSIKGDVLVGVTSSGNNSIYGQPVTFTATVSGVAPATGTPTQTVNFIIDGGAPVAVTLNGAGQAQFTTSTLTVSGSPHTVAVQYLGDTRFFTGNGTLAGGQTIQVAASTTSVVQSSVTSVFGEPVVFTAHVSAVPAGGVPTGTVNFIIDGGTAIARQLNASGDAVLNKNDIPVGAGHTIQAVYVGDGNVAGSSGNSPNHNVVQATSQLALAASPATSVISQQVTFTATVTAVSPSTATPTGFVTFVIDGGAPIVVALNAAGQASVSTSTLTVGAHNVTATFAATTEFAGSNGNIGHTVNPNPVSFFLVPASAVSGTAFSVVVRYLNGTNPDPTFNGPVTLAINSGPGGTLTGATTVNAAGGVATFTNLRLDKAGSYTLRATAGTLPPVVSPLVAVTASSLVAGVSRVNINKPFTLSSFGVDVTGGIAANYNGAFTLTVVKRPAGGRVLGPKAGVFSGGFAQLAGLKVSRAGTYMLRINGPNGLSFTIRLAVGGRRRVPVR